MNELLLVDVVSPRVCEHLAIGKYSHWANRITADSLLTLMWAVGAYGSIADLARQKTGRWPQPILRMEYPMEQRVGKALSALLHVQTGTDDVVEPQAGGEYFSDPHPAFLESFEKRLSDHQHTRWAMELNERQLWVVLWYVGEYSTRAGLFRPSDFREYLAPPFDAAPEAEYLMRRALQVMTGIYFRHIIDIETAQSHVFGPG
jgi:hypothetical protein